MLYTTYYSNFRETLLLVLLDEYLFIVKDCQTFVSYCIVSSWMGGGDHGEYRRRRSQNIAANPHCPCSVLSHILSET